MKQTMKLWLIVWSVVAGMQVVSAASSGFSWGDGADEATFFDDASAKIESRVAQGKIPALDGFYKGMLYAPLWVKAGGLSPFGNTLLRMIRTDETVTQSVAVYQENLDVRKQLQELVTKKGGTLREKVAMELVLSKLYLHYARYRIYGGISWAPFKKKLDALTKSYKIKVGWETYAPKATPASILNNALNDGDLARAFEAADPQRFAFVQLRDQLVRYIRMAQKGGWPKLPRFGTQTPGTSSAKVIPLIRQHLAMVGDLRECTEPADSPRYDPCMVKALKRFQLRHGLEGDGVIGAGTRDALNMTVTQAIQKIRLNLDRIKWLYRKQSPMRIELNIPSFRLNFFNGDKLVTTIRVVTGKPNHPTPSFHNVMKYIIVNPYWKIPASIVRSEMLRHLVSDPYHYEAQGKILKASWDESSERIDPGTVDWSQFVGNNKPIPYYFMQVPSRHNALGKIKFLFPNGYSVYIHDTPSKSLFFRKQRAFSHGCMRIQKPRELLESLALFNDNIDVEAVMKQLEGTEKKTIVLKYKVPIDITYLTAYIDPYGNLNFRKDVYHYDKYQLKDYASKSISFPSKPIKKQSAKPSPSKPVAPKHPVPTPVTRASQKSIDADDYRVIELYGN
jgi:murein L,D-transpeptidase YcbB/YkuD